MAELLSRQEGSGLILTTGFVTGTFPTHWEEAMFWDELWLTFWQQILISCNISIARMQV